MCLRGWDIKMEHIFQAKIIKKQTCDPNMFFDTSNHRKLTEMTQNGFQWGTQNPPKIDENLLWDHSGRPLVHLRHTWLPKWHQNTIQGPPNGSKMIFLGTQKDVKIHKIQHLLARGSFIESMFSILKIFLILQIPSVLQVPPVHKLLNCCWPEGPAAGAKP